MLLFAACQATLQGAALPAGSGASRTVFIPESAEVNPESPYPLARIFAAIDPL